MEYKLSEVFEKPISGEWGAELVEGKNGVKVIQWELVKAMGL